MIVNASSNSARPPREKRVGADAADEDRSAAELHHHQREIGMPIVSNCMHVISYKGLAIAIGWAVSCRMCRGPDPAFEEGRSAGKGNSFPFLADITVDETGNLNFGIKSYSTPVSHHFRVAGAPCHPVWIFVPSRHPAFQQTDAGYLP